ncbi:MAG: BamA/TamA family outer membrane protein [Rikenellaceae bacterium]
MSKIYISLLGGTILLISLFAPQSIYAQEGVEPTEVDELMAADSVELEEYKNLRFSILGGPGYTPDYGFLVGGSALITFDMPGMKGFERRSVLPVAFSLSFSKSVSVSFLVRPQLFLKGDQIRIMGDYIYSNLSSNYYGVGFTHNKSVIRDEQTTQYFYSQVKVNPIVLFRLGTSDWFLGPMAHLQYDKLTDPAQGIIDDADYIAVGGDANGYSTLENGVGFALNFDSRDIPANAFGGMYFDIRGMIYGDYLGGEHNFQTFQFKYRQYVQLSTQTTGRTLAWSVSSDNVFGDAPFTRLSMIGSPFDLRGYYQGQYRDNSAHIAMVEYRHKFHAQPVNFWSKLYNRLGYVVWSGVGLMGPSPFEIEGVLPNYGAGLRIEVQPRMNFRLDAGRSPLEKQTLIYFNMTEAF